MVKKGGAWSTNDKTFRSGWSRTELVQQNPGTPSLEEGSSPFLGQKDFQPAALGINTLPCNFTDKKNVLFGAILYQNRLIQNDNTFIVSSTAVYMLKTSSQNTRKVRKQQLIDLCFHLITKLNNPRSHNQLNPPKKRERGLYQTQQASKFVPWHSQKIQNTAFHPITWYFSEL